jgi:hypothetical protein
MVVHACLDYLARPYLKKRERERETPFPSRTGVREKGLDFSWLPLPFQFPTFLCLGENIWMLEGSQKRGHKTPSQSSEHRVLRLLTNEVR